MITRYCNANVLSGDKIIQGELVVYDTMIAHIGDPVLGLMADKEIDMDGALIIPTFKDAHTAISYVVDHKYIHRDYIPWLLKLSIINSIKNGIGSVTILTKDIDLICPTIENIGIRSTIIFTLTNNLLENIDVNEYLDEELSKKKNLFDVKLGLKNIREFSPENLEKISKYVHLKNIEIYPLIEDGDIDILNKYDLIKNIGAVFVLEKLDKKEIDVLKDNNISIVLNSSNMKIFFEYEDFYKLNISIGTYDKKIKNEPDMFRQMYAIESMQNVFTEKEIVNMVNKNQSTALHVKGSKDINNNMFADFIVINTKNTNIGMINDVYNFLINSCSSKDIQKVVVNGKMIYDREAYLTIDNVPYVVSVCETILNNSKED